MVLWFGLKERMEKIEENLEEVSESMSEFAKALESISKSIEKLNDMQKTTFTVKPEEIAPEQLSSSEKRIQQLEKLNAKVERIKYQTLLRKIEALERALGTPVVGEAIEETTGLNKDFISQIMDFVKQNPDIISKVQQLIQQWSSAQTPEQKEQAKQDIYSKLEELAKPIPLKSSEQK
jgi:phage-related tail protein